MTQTTQTTVVAAVPQVARGRREGPATGETLLEVNNLEKFFPIRGGLLSRVVGNVKAVNDVSFKLGRGEVVGLVGESGSGKTTAGRAILRLIEPTGGQVIFNGTDITVQSDYFADVGDPRVQATVDESRPIH